MYTPLTNGVLFLKDRYVRLYEYGSGKVFRSCPSGASSSGSSVARRCTQRAGVNAARLAGRRGRIYELYQVTRDGQGSESVSTECKRGLGTSACFVARQRFAVLDKNRQILIKNFQNEVTKKCAPPHPSTDWLFPAGTGSLLLRSEERISLYDIQQRKAIAEVSAPVGKSGKPRPLPEPSSNPCHPASQ